MTSLFFASFPGREPGAADGEISVRTPLKFPGTRFRPSTDTATVAGVGVAGRDRFSRFSAAVEGTVTGLGLTEIIAFLMALSGFGVEPNPKACLLYTSDAADE